MAMLYLPGSRRPAGKLNSPLAFDTTVVVMVAPSFLALTRTPSIRPSASDETLPDSIWALAVAIRAKLAEVASSSDFRGMARSPLGNRNWLRWIGSTYVRSHMFARFLVPAY